MTDTSSNLTGLPADAEPPGLPEMKARVGRLAAGPACAQPPLFAADAADAPPRPPGGPLTAAPAGLEPGRLLDLPAPP